MTHRDNKATILKPRLNFLLFARCSLLVTLCSLLVTLCALQVTFCALLVTFCSLLVTFLLVACSSLLPSRGAFNIFVPGVTQVNEDAHESKILSCYFCVWCKSKELGGRGSPRFRLDRYFFNAHVYVPKFFPNLISKW